MNAGAFTLSPHPLRQLAAHMRARRRPVPAWLSAAEAALFKRLAPADQVEGLAVVQTLRMWGYEGDRSLLVAGLLHDVGKSLAPSGAVYRMAFTIMERAPEVLRRPTFKSIRPLAILAEHARLGAELAARERLPDDVVGLIRDHHSPAGGPRMQALQRADGQH